MFNDVISNHLDIMRDGWDYHFNAGPDPLAQHTGQRATFRKYQSYPENSVQGRGILVRGGEGNQPGYKWNPFQPPQVYVQQRAINADFYGAGHAAGTIAMQALIQG